MSLLHKIYLDNQLIDLDIIYRKRKTMELRIESPTKILVVAPTGLPKDYILEKVQERKAWILKKLKLISEHAQVQELTIADGIMLSYLGQQHLLKIEQEPLVTKPCVVLSQSGFIIKTTTIEQEALKLALRTWYQAEAMSVIAERVKIYGAEIGKFPLKLKLSNAKKRWGSCSSKGTVLVNWRMIMAPIEAMDYVIIHELCHLRQMNHSKEFWNLVAQLMPDYKKWQLWLLENGATLYVID